MNSQPFTMRFIAGSGRSGTTWLQDALSQANGLRAIFEPLNPGSSRIASKYANSYLDAADVCDDLFEYMRGAANGDMHTLWTHYRIPRYSLAPKSTNFKSISTFKRYLNQWQKACTKLIKQPSQRSNSLTLVKCVRANLILDWLCARFDARIILLIRHPGAVVESQLRSAYRTWNPYPVLERYGQNRRLLEGPLSGLGDLLSSKLDPAEALTLVWCVQNLVPLSQARRNKYTIVFYEELLEHPERHWPRICEALGLETVPETRLLDAPSQQASANWSADRQFDKGYTISYDRWRNDLDRIHHSQIQSVLERAGIQFYAVDESRPRVDGLADLSASPPT